MTFITPTYVAGTERASAQWGIRPPRWRVRKLPTPASVQDRRELAGASLAFNARYITSRTSVDLPDPLTPPHADQPSQRQFHGHVLKVMERAPTTSHPPGNAQGSVSPKRAALSLPVTTTRSRIFSERAMAEGEPVFTTFPPFGQPPGPGRSRIGGQDDRFLVFDDDHSISAVAKARRSPSGGPARLVDEGPPLARQGIANPSQV